MADKVSNYQCPACTAPLRFDNKTGRLVCDYCESTFTPAEIEAYYAEADAKAEEAFQDAPDPAPEVVSAAEKAEMRKTRWDESTISADWGEDSANMRAYSCPSCGAELLCELTTAATQCPYCGNPSIVPGQFGGSLRPDYVIPFKLGKEDAVAALKKHFLKRVFLPRAFTSDNQIYKIQGVYVPFWLFDGEAAAECWFEGRNLHTHREGDYKVTRTDHFDVRRFGRVRFERVPTDASNKMPDSLMDSLEPYDYNGLEPFSTAYLPGYVADKYDVTVSESTGRANRRCTNTAVQIMRQDVHGYQQVSEKRKKVYMDRGDVKYALLPVWLLQVKWKDNHYLFAMNGQTGKMVGDLPVDKTRFWGLCGGLTAALTLLLYFIGAGGGIVRFIQALLEAFFS